jgi:hypothetical protein
VPVDGQEHMRPSSLKGFPGGVLSRDTGKWRLPSGVPPPQRHPPALFLTASLLAVRDGSGSQGDRVPTLAFAPVKRVLAGRARGTADPAGRLPSQQRCRESFLCA